MEEKREIIESKKTVFGFILFSLIAGILFSVFFFDYVGISYAIFVVYLTVGYFVFYGVKNKSFMGYFLISVSLILSISYAIFTNPVFRILNILVIPAGLFSGFILLTYSNITLELIKFTKTFCRVIFLNSFVSYIKLPRFILNLMKYKKKKSESSAYKSVVLGLCISVPVVAVLCVFLSGADGMFGYYLDNLINNIISINVNVQMYKIVWTILVTFFVFGLYWSFSDKFDNMEGKGPSKRNFEPVIIITILIVVNLLYMVFTMVQVYYLYVAKVLPSGITYAEYARSGFFQLVFLVVLNLMMITFLKLKTKSTGKNQNFILLSLYSIITVLTFNMAFSALYKMNLYIAAFGYTRLRLLVQVFTLFLLLVLCLLTIFIWKGINLFKPILFAAAVIYLSLNFFNIDNYIVNRNISLSPTIRNFDEEYLSVLSFDAVSAMGKALAENKISIETYNKWLKYNMVNQEHWYEYNYYAAKGGR